MPRKVKHKVEVNNTDSLQGLMQEVYNDACLNISQAQNAINELTTSVKPTDVEDATKIAKEKANLLKVKDSGFRTKLEVAKLQSDIIKNHGNVDEAVQTRSNGTVSVDDFDRVREMLNRKNYNEDINE